jgi:hypothetical protein
MVTELLGEKTNLKQKQPHGPWSVPDMVPEVRYFNLEPVVREILTLGEGFTTQVVTLWCFNTVLRPSALVP